MTCRPECSRLVVAFDVPIRPKPKGRPRFTRNGKPYTDEATAAYEGELYRACKAAMREQGATTADGDVAVLAVFEQTDGRRSDADNLVKSLLDGIAGDDGAMKNDRQVTRIDARMVVRAPVNRVSVAVLRAVSS